MGKSEITAEKLEVANRLREIRMSAGFTQEQFSEIIDVSLSAYKKIESAENQMSLDGLRRIVKEFNVSADYILFGKMENVDDTWKMIMNCSEDDKMFFLLRLINYFSEAKDGKYYVREEQARYDGNILKYLRDELVRENK